MKKNKLCKEQISAYISFLKSEEKSHNTIEKYHRDVTAFFAYLENKEHGKGMCEKGVVYTVTKADVTDYRDSLKKAYRTTSINSMVVAINGFLKFAGCNDCTVKTLKVQKQLFKLKEEMLEKSDYFKLITAADKKGDFRLARLMETIGSTGIRISELKFITVEAVKSGSAEVVNKGKHRRVIIPEELCKKLLNYAEKQGIKSGSIFVSSKGNSLDRSYVWKQMKELCKTAGVSPVKVFPHNMRHLFAVTFYRKHKDLAALANILGHSNTETTRIYVSVCSDDYKRQVESTGLIQYGKNKGMNRNIISNRRNRKGQRKRRYEAD